MWYWLLGHVGSTVSWKWTQKENLGLAMWSLDWQLLIIYCLMAFVLWINNLEKDNDETQENPTSYLYNSSSTFQLIAQGNQHSIF